MLNLSPNKKSRPSNRLSTHNSSLDESLRNLMKFAQSEYGLANTQNTQGDQKSTEEMISIIKSKLVEFQDSVRGEQSILSELKKECKFLQDAFQASKRLKQKSQGQDYLAILTAEATNEFFSSRLAKMRDDYEEIQTQISTRKELIALSNQKGNLEKDLSKKSVLISNLEKSIANDEKSRETSFKKYEIVKEKELGIKGELETLKSDIRDLRSLKKEIEDDTREIEDWILKERLKSILIQNSENADQNEKDLLQTNSKISKVKERISNVENEISCLEGEILEKKKEKIGVIENYIAISNKFDEIQKPSGEKMPN